MKQCNLEFHFDLKKAERKRWGRERQTERERPFILFAGSLPKRLQMARAGLV